MSKDDEHTIGYGRPPAWGRFTPGKSGNPKGRPKGRLNFRALIKNAFVKPIGIRVGTSTRRIPRIEAIVLKQIERALQGNERAAQAAIKLAVEFGLLSASSEDTYWDFGKLTDEELVVLEQLVAKMQARRTE